MYYAAALRTFLFTSVKCKFKLHQLQIKNSPFSLWELLTFYLTVSGRKGDIITKGGPAMEA